MVRVAHDLAWRQDVSEHSLTIIQRNAAQIIAIDIEKIENVVKHGQIRPGSGLGAMASKSRPLLHQTERRAAVLIEDDDFSIENRRFCIHQFRRIAQFGIARREVVLVT